MPYLPINHSDRNMQTNRKYWKLKEMLPKDEQFPLPVSCQFHTKRDIWICSSGFVDMARYVESLVLRHSEWLEIEFTNLTRYANVFDLRVGIVRKSGKEIVASNAKIILPKRTAIVRVIQRVELHKIMHSYNDLELFLIVDEKSSEMKKNEEKDKFHMQKFRMDYKELLLSGRNSDFTVNVKSVKFEVHSSILGARSPVFSAMIEHEMKEKLTGEVSIIDADPAIFREFLLYLYTGNEEHLNWENIVELYRLGDKYCVEDLKYLCMEHMKIHISIENFFEIFYISRHTNNSELSKIVIQFFLEDLNEILASETCTEFMKENPEETYILMKALPAVEYFLK